MNPKIKLEKLKKLLSSLDSVIIAYSGGIDSTFLLKVAGEVLPARLIAVTAVSDTYHPAELKRAVGLARKFSARHMIIQTNELKNRRFAGNSPERCYYCKKELFSRLNDIAKKFKFNSVVDATNFDDTRDYRPGTKAAKELGIISPLKEVKLHKKEIRMLAKNLNLPNWNAPENVCLASRVPYGTKITPRRLKMIKQAEDFLKSLGFKKLRVRLEKCGARIEVPDAEVQRFLNKKLRQKIVDKFKKLRFIYVSLDLEGYRQGSMNEVLKLNKRQ